MNKTAFLAAACAAALLASPALRASPVTYQFTGIDFGAYNGQTISGTYTYDPAYYTGFATDGATYGQSYVNGAPSGSVSAAWQFSGGHTGGFGGANPLGVTFQTIVQKGFVRSDVGAVDAFEVYGGSNNAAGGYSVLELLTQQPASTPDLIFPGAAPGDFSPTQPVSFLTSGSMNIGYYAEFNAAGLLVASGDFEITSITTAVPEAPTTALMVAGLAMLAIGGRRRQARALSGTQATRA
jgi:hypothetical protein